MEWTVTELRYTIRTNKARWMAGLLDRQRRGNRGSKKNPATCHEIVKMPPPPPLLVCYFCRLEKKYFCRENQ
jgi:hypothetical protein